MGPKIPDNTGAEFEREVERLFFPDEEEEQDEEERGDKNSERK